jgi:hypothetical protein
LGIGVIIAIAAISGVIFLAVAILLVAYFLYNRPPKNAWEKY